MRTIFLRACRDTSSALGWNGRTLVVGAMLVSIGKGANIFRIGFGPAMTSVMDWVYSAVIPIAGTFLLLFAYNLWLAPLRIAREVRVGPPTPSRKADIALYQGLDRYRLDEAACLWFGAQRPSAMFLLSYNPFRCLPLPDMAVPANVLTT